MYSPHDCTTGSTGGQARRSRPESARSRKWRGPSLCHCRTAAMVSLTSSSQLYVSPNAVVCESFMFDQAGIGNTYKSTSSSLRARPQHLPKRLLMPSPIEFRAIPIQDGRVIAEKNAL